MDISQFRQAIHLAFPQLEIQSIQRINTGWDAWIFEVDSLEGELIFRLPQRPEIAEGHLKEIKLLPYLSDALLVHVPVYKYIYPPGRYFEYGLVGYRKIPGAALDQEMASLPPIVQQIGRFLSDLHAFPLELAQSLGIPGTGGESWRQVYLEFYAWIRNNLFPLLDKTGRSYTCELWENYLDKHTNFEFQPALIHGDLAGEHLLCDSSLAAITGVIDWEDATVGDPALDFVGLWFVGSAPFVERILANYSKLVDNGFWNRIHFYADIVPFHEIRFGLSAGEPEHLQHGLSMIKKGKSE